ncbi:hypothetical protein GSI_14213 [Ganoderma sinense ZZ0214-1]|uniref:Methyltransferase domain-containing protein n=1 Tax=Ganoderma sinense ZZ0214-1 TaxID=1077348 RepID=A0A2G8RSH0_9APHY|nr:hypothetical protein GSI_14213 [Ganoderma sinense ZZ0214-1]
MAPTGEGEKENHSSNALDTGLKLYDMDEEGLTFMKAQTGIEDEEELKKHILAIRAEGYSIFPYHCIMRFAFLQLRLARLPAYNQLLALGTERKDAIFLDIGCCFGYDVRKAINDGFPIGSVIAADLHPEFWELGHKLFKSTPETFPVPFLPGDAFDPVFLEPTAPFTASHPPPAPRPDLSTRTLTALNPLRGHVSAIHASAFFHLFDEERQAQLARSLACLLSPEPGSMLIGGHRGLPEAGVWTDGRWRRAGEDGTVRFGHSPESWAALWDGQVFEKGTVRVEAVLREVERAPDVAGAESGDTKSYNLCWSVTRL